MVLLTSLVFNDGFYRIRLIDYILIYSETIKESISSIAHSTGLDQKRKAISGKVGLIIEIKIWKTPKMSSAKALTKDEPKKCPIVADSFKQNNTECQLIDLSVPGGQILAIFAQKSGHLRTNLSHVRRKNRFISKTKISNSFRLTDFSVMSTRKTLHLIKKNVRQKAGFFKKT